jgi:mono/diheme cytochrome c family protein
VTEVPEHLLRRSKDARARAAGGGGGGEGSDTPATPGEAPGTGAAASAVEPAGGAAVAPAAAAAAPAEPATPVPPYVAAALRRPKVPKYGIAVLAALPVWALIYAGALVKTAPADPVFEEGRGIYQAQCSGCHGPNGTDGQTGRPLNQVTSVFPDVADHVAWIENGSPGAGTPYGDEAVGRVSGSDGYTTPMPGFKDDLTAEQIAAVAYYERVEFGGQEPTAPGAEGAEGATSSGGEGH